MQPRGQRGGKRLRAKKAAELLRSVQQADAHNCRMFQAGTVRREWRGRQSVVWGVVVMVFAKCTSVGVCLCVYVCVCVCVCLVCAWGSPAYVHATSVNVAGHAISLTRTPPTMWLRPPASPMRGVLRMTRHAIAHAISADASILQRTHASLTALFTGASAHAAASTLVRVFV
jgi:hypothetical protein